MLVLQEIEAHGVGGEMKLIQRELNVLLEKIDSQWEQRAKIDWLWDDDRNTKFYRACANSRRKSNTIYSISNVDGRLCIIEEDVQLAFVNYFDGLFTNEIVENLMPCLPPLNSRVIAAMNCSLLQPFTEEEVHLALSQMAALKAPGPNGFLAEFYQKNWSLVGDNMCRAIIGSLNLGILLEFLNLTNIALIPEKKNPTSVTKFRLISLGNALINQYPRGL